MSTFNKETFPHTSLKNAVCFSLLVYVACVHQVSTVTGITLEIKPDLIKAICVQTKEFVSSRKLQLGLKNRSKYQSISNNVKEACGVICLKPSGGKCTHIKQLTCDTGNQRSRGKLPTSDTFSGSGGGGTAGSSGKFKVYSVTPTDNFQIDSLTKMSDAGVDFWVPPTKQGVPCEFMLSPTQQDQYLPLERSDSMQMKELLADVKEEISKETIKKAVPPGELTWDAFYNLDDINAFIENLETKYPDNAKVLSYGQSYENRPLKLIHISESHSASGSAAVKKPIVFIECNIHAREWISVAMCTFLINKILEDKTECISTFLTQFEFYVIPVANPDGYAFSHVPDGNSRFADPNRLWTKTRSVSSNSKCLGADAYRNFDVHWNESGATSRCSISYRGSKPNSEVEVEKLRMYLLTPEISSRIKVYLSIHSFAESLLPPWDTANQTIIAQHSKFFMDTTNDAIAAIAKRYGTQYKQAANAFGYTISGSSVGWVYENILRQKTEDTYCVNIELRRSASGFLVLGDEIIPTSLEAMDGICVIMKAVGGGGTVKPPVMSTKFPPPIPKPSMKTTMLPPLVTKPPLPTKVPPPTNRPAIIPTQHPPTKKPLITTTTIEPDCA